MRKTTFFISAFLIVNLFFVMSIPASAFSLPATGSLSISITHTKSDCLTTNGTATANVTGGTGNYTYSWSNGQTTQTATGLSAATYTVYVMDDGGNNDYKDIYIGLNNAPVINIVINNHVLCYGEKNGKATAFVTGGVPPYQYKWCEGSTTDVCSDFKADDHYLDVIDSTGCLSRKWLVITEPPQLTSNLVVTDASSCAASDGSVDVIVSGGASPYSYSWDFGATTNSVTGLAAGNYSITITDVNACQKVQAVTINCTTGLPDMASGEFATISFPNPTNGRFVVDLKKTNVSPTNYSLSVYNLMGEKIVQSNCAPGKSEIDISQYSNGMYFLEVRNGNEAITRKLVLEK